MFLALRNTLATIAVLSVSYCSYQSLAQTGDGSGTYGGTGGGTPITGGTLNPGSGAVQVGDNFVCSTNGSGLVSNGTDFDCVDLNTAIDTGVDIVPGVNAEIVNNEFRCDIPGSADNYEINFNEVTQAWDCVRPFKMKLQNFGGAFLNALHQLQCGIGTSILQYDGVDSWYCSNYLHNVSNGVNIGSSPLDNFTTTFSQCAIKGLSVEPGDTVRFEANVDLELTYTSAVEVGAEIAIRNVVTGVEFDTSRYSVNNGVLSSGRTYISLSAIGQDTITAAGNNQYEVVWRNTSTSGTPRARVWRCRFGHDFWRP